MATNKELILWTKGLSFDTLSSIQQPGFLKTAENVSFEIEGKQTLRQKFDNINSTAIGSIHTIKKWRSILVAGNGGVISSSNDGGNFTTRYSSLSGEIIYFRTYKNFLVGCNGGNFFLMDLNHNIYPAQIDNPTIAPTGASDGIGAQSTGGCVLYVSYLITWPNGHTYETGLSPASGDIDPSAGTHIDWQAIPTLTYTAYYGTAATVHRKLYRGPGTTPTPTLTDIFYVDTIEDNTTLTYEDTLSDTELSAHETCYVEDYDHPRIPKYIEFHYGRAFMVDATYNHRLYWTEVAGGATSSENENLMPLATLDDSYDDMRVSGFEFVDPQGLFSWGVNLYIPLKDTWIRKQGNDPTTWAYRKTYAKHGIGAPHTVDFSSSPGGIIGVTNPEYGEPGLAIFGGQTSEIFTSPKLDYIFNTDMNLDFIHKCRGKMAGRTYHLLYPSSTSTEPDTYLAIDLRRFPEIRVAKWTDLNGICIDSDHQGKKFYIGTSTGYVKTKSEGGLCNILLETHDLIGGDPKIFNEQKTWTELKYSLNGTVTLEVYIDDTLMKWPDNTTFLTLTGTSEIIQFRKFPHNAKGYKIRLKLTGTALSTCEIYSPWQLSFD